MLATLNFDPNIYFGIVAENLTKRFGMSALRYASQALCKMKNLGDDEGLELWRGIHKHLLDIAMNEEVPAGTVLH